MREIEKQDTVVVTDSTALKIVCCNDDAKPPFCGSDKAAGYDLYGVQLYNIPSRHVGLIDTELLPIFLLAHMAR